jgi:hypothetical protein
MGRPGPTAYSENIFSLAETLKLFITNHILNEMLTRRVTRAMGVTCKQLASPTAVKNGGGIQCGRALFVQQLRTVKQTGNVASAQNGCAGNTVSRQLK